MKLGVTLSERGADISQAILKDVEVLKNSDGDGADGNVSTSGGVKKTLTTAVTLPEAEKIVFAEEKGKIWVTLLPAAKAGSSLNSAGQTMETVFH